MPDVIVPAATQMKPNTSSRLFWFSVTSAGLSTLTSSLAVAGIPLWVIAIISSLSAAAAFGVVMLRVSDYSQQGGPK